MEVRVGREEVRGSARRGAESGDRWVMLSLDRGSLASSFSKSTHLWCEACGKVVEHTNQTQQAAVPKYLYVSRIKQTNRKQWVL
jgi:hypothetical protein